MPLSTFITAIMLLAFGVVVLVCLAGLLLTPALHLFKLKKGSTRVNRSTKRIQKADTLITEGKFKEALKELRRSVVFEAANSPQRVEAIKDHHQSILSRCLIIAEELGSRAENIAEVERLFLQRAELQQLLLKAVESYQNLRSRRKQAGKQMPNWSKTDFEKRIVDVKKEMKKNEESLGRALDSFFSSLSTPSKDQIVYH